MTYKLPIFSLISILIFSAINLSAQEFWISAILSGVGCGDVNDSDGNTYTTTIIGGKCWMSENLKVGTRINGSTEQSNNGSIEKYCYDDSEANCDKYGGLYLWEEMMLYSTGEGSQGICPAGWHIPSDGEWASLKSLLGVASGGQLKSTETIGTGGSWYEPNTGADNSSGFNGLPGGLIDNSGVSFYLEGYDGYYWSSTELDVSRARTRRLRFIDDDIAGIDYLKSRGLSVRCVKGFECGGAITDPRDWQAYATVEIDAQCWMAENLNIGQRIDGIYNQTDDGDIEKYCIYDQYSKCDDYGGLYQWDEMMDYSTQSGTQGICPAGWHLPSEADWTALINYLGGLGLAGGEMKTTGTLQTQSGLWYDPNEGATNSSGFSGLPGGSRYHAGGLPSGHEYFGSFWSSGQADATNAYSKHLHYINDDVSSFSIYKTYGYSVRCLRD